MSDDIANEDDVFHEVAYERWWSRNCPDSLQSPESESEANAIEAIKISFMAGCMAGREVAYMRVKTALEERIGL
jgi:hypothetical protein